MTETSSKISNQFLGDLDGDYCLLRFNVSYKASYYLQDEINILFLGQL